MRKTTFSLVVGTIILLLGIYISNLIIDLNKTEVTYNNKSLTSVYAQKVSNKSNSMILFSSGKLISSKRIDLFSEVSGIVKVNPKQKFKEGNSFKKDEILSFMNRLYILGVLKNFVFRLLKNTHL